MKPLEPAKLEDIHAARERIRGAAIRTPLVRLEVESCEAEIWLKLENLQPIGSFKLRGAGNALARIPRAELERGVYTASAGNMAQGLAWVARRMGVPCRVVVPDSAPQAKLRAIARLGAEALRVPFDDWWRVLEVHRHPGLEGRFVHPVCDADVIAGNGTIGLEILEDLPDVDTVVVPYGGGGLSSGIASALRALRPASRVLAAEVETAAPLAPSLAAGAPRQIDYRPSFVDGIGSKSVLEPMWPLVRELLAGSRVVTLEQVAEAMRVLATRARVIAEGAGASSLAVALAGQAGAGKVVCVISGGNVDPEKLATILEGRLP